MCMPCSFLPTNAYNLKKYYKPRQTVSTSSSSSRSISEAMAHNGTRCLSRRAQLAFQSREWPLFVRVASCQFKKHSLVAWPSLPESSPPPPPPLPLSLSLLCLHLIYIRIKICPGIIIIIIGIREVYRGKDNSEATLEQSKRYTDKQ